MSSTLFATQIKSRSCDKDRSGFGQGLSDPTKVLWASLGDFLKKLRITENTLVIQGGLVEARTGPSCQAPGDPCMMGAFYIHSLRCPAACLLAVGCALQLSCFEMNSDPPL